MSYKLDAGAQFPALPLQTTTGQTLDPAGLPGWRVVVVYRGKHCPLCKIYLKTLNGMLDDLAAVGVSVLAVSADPVEKATADVEAEGWRFPVAYGLTIAQMHTLGLYISEPRAPTETDRPFAEPGLFVLNPAGKAHMIDISNAPFSRPELSGIFRGIKMAQDKAYPTRGTMT